MNREMTYKNCQGLQWIIVSGAVFIIIGIALNAIVGQTMGLLSVAFVLLALYVAFWAFAVGSLVLVLVSFRILAMDHPAVSRPVALRARARRWVEGLTRALTHVSESHF
jgi:hypothetical protein